MKSWFNKNVLAIYITSLFSYQLQMAVVLLGSMYAWYPNLSENVVVLMYSAPPSWRRRSAWPSVR